MAEKVIFVMEIVVFVFVHHQSICSISAYHIITTQLAKQKMNKKNSGLHKS
jgi:hypothetical protein